ncbi:hypothetical protein Ancab_017536 [Ancistrocladus abbreviatus]
MALNLRHCRWKCAYPSPAILASPPIRRLRSDAALEAIARASAERTPNIALYNYPSISGAFSALFVHLFHYKLSLPCLVLPFSSVVPFRKSTLKKISSSEDCKGKLTFHIDVKKSSSNAVYQYFSNVFEHINSADGNGVGGSLLDTEDRERVELVLKYIEDGDLRQWKLSDTWAFSIGVGELRSKINCIANPHMFEQLLRLSNEELIAQGNSCVLSRQDAAKKLLLKVFKLRLGRGFYGECLGVTADQKTDLTDEMGKELSLRSAAAGLRPIGAVIYMQHNNLKMCLRSIDSSTDTSEVAKAYGGGGSPSSSSFIIRMDEYNQWLTVDSPT